MAKPLQVLETLSGRRSATDGEPDDRNGKRKNNKQQAGGMKDDVTMGRHELGTERGSQHERQQDHRREFAERRLQNTLRLTSTSAGSQRRMCWTIKQGQLRANSEQAASKGKGHSLRPPGIAACTGLLQALSERGSPVGATNAAGVATFRQLWDELEPEGAFDMVPHCKLAKVYDAALCRLELVISVAEHREHIRGAIGQTGANRLFSQAPSGARERAISSALEQAI